MHLVGGTKPNSCRPVESKECLAQLEMEKITSLVTKHLYLKQCFA